MNGKTKRTTAPTAGRFGSQPYTLAQAARLLRINKQRVRALIDKGELPAELCIPGEALVAHMDKQRQAAAA